MWRNTFGDWGKTCSVTLRKRIRRFSVKMFRRFGESFGDNFGGLEKLIQRNRGWRFGEIIRRFWRKPFVDFELELIMEYRNARRPYVEIEK